MNLLTKLFLGLMSGVVLSFIQAPYSLWILLFPCFSLFYFLYASLENKKQVFALSFIFSLGYFVVGLSWIGNALLVEGNDYKWAWPIAVIALPALLSLFTALYLTVNFIVFRNNKLAKFVGFFLFLSLAEWTRGYAFTGFPWNLYGYGIAANPELSQILSVIGPYGLTLLTIFWGSFFGLLITKPNYKILLSVLVISSFALTYSYGHQRLQNTILEFNEDINVHIVQPNIPQAEKWKNENIASNFERHATHVEGMLTKKTKHLIIWPETAIPPILLSSRAVHQRIQSMLGNNALLLSGALVMKNEEPETSLNYYNALLGWSKNENGKMLYSKSHLVPFGEYIPFQKYIPIPTVTKFSRFQRGDGPQTIKIENYPSFSPLICYEIIFPNKVVNKKAPRPDYILTITNDAWYGDSAGPRQHFAQARFRAIEQGIPVLRSANTGISGIIAPNGQVLSKKPLSEAGSLNSSLPKPLKKPTFYSQYHDIPFLIFLFFGLIFSIFATRTHFHSKNTKN